MNPIETVNEHYKVIIEKNLDGILDKYFPAEQTYVVLEGPRLTTIGFEKISKGWTDFCVSPITLESINWTEGPFTEVQDNMAWVAGIVQLKVKIGNNYLENTFRSTFVLVLHNNKWKIQHEHVSVAHPNPYGIGDWLK